MAKKEREPLGMLTVHGDPHKHRGSLLQPGALVQAVKAHPRPQIPGHLRSGPGSVPKRTDPLTDTEKHFSWQITIFLITFGNG